MALPRMETDVIPVREAVCDMWIPSFDRIKRLEDQIDRLLSRLRIGVVYGGDKCADGAVIHQTVNTRSWKSYEEVAGDLAASLKRIGFRNVEMISEDMRLGDRLSQDEIHLAWLNSGGVQGYNPMAHAPCVLEMLGVPYVGHDPLSAGTLDNKHVFKRDLAGLGYRTSPFITWHLSRGPFRPRVNSRFINTFKDHWGSYIVKPVSGRASLHVKVVETEDELTDAVAEVFEATENHVMIETYLPGREYCVAVSGPIVAKNGALEDNGEPFAFSETERVFDPGEKIVTSKDIKPITDNRLRLLNPADDAKTIAELRQLAQGVYVDFNLNSVIRMDLREDEEGNISILEANPKPDLKRPDTGVTSAVCNGLSAHGMDYDDLILGLLANRLDQLLNVQRQAGERISGLVE